MRFHSQNQRLKVIGFDSKMVHRASSRRFRRLVVNLKERVAKREPYVPHASSLIVPYNGGTEHRAKKLDGGREVRREDVYVIEPDTHDQ